MAEIVVRDSAFIMSKNQAYAANRSCGAARPGRTCLSTLPQRCPGSSIGFERVPGNFPGRWSRWRYAPRVWSADLAAHIQREGLRRARNQLGQHANR